MKLAIAVFSCVVLKAMAFDLLGNIFTGIFLSPKNDVLSIQRDPLTHLLTKAIVNQVNDAVSIHQHPQYLKDLALAGDVEVVFRLFTRYNQNHGQVLSWNNSASIRNSNFNSRHPTRFIVHGWKNDGASSIHTKIRANYFKVGEFNVICVDWGKAASSDNYYYSRRRISSVGRAVSGMIDELVEATGISRDSINIVGHSLGAHAAGFAGKLQNGQLNTIVGLDPASPEFPVEAYDRLKSKDAQYVEVVLTSRSFLGTSLPLGIANFFANGGASQPGCGSDPIGTCAHSRAYDLFAESLSTTVGFRATKCSWFFASTGSCSSSGPDAMMGGEPSNHGRGVEGSYSFNTNAEEPYAQG